MSEDLLSQLKRLKIASGSITDTGLADVLGVSQGAISSAKIRNKIPDNWFVKISKAFGVNLAWLTTGEGEMKAGDTLTSAQIRRAMKVEVPILSPDDPDYTPELALVYARVGGLEQRIEGLEAENKALNELQDAMKTTIAALQEAAKSKDQIINMQKEIILKIGTNQVPPEVLAFIGLIPGPSASGAPDSVPCAPSTNQPSE